MNRKLLIKALEIIENENGYISTKDLSGKLGLKFHMNGELLQIVNYLHDSKKIKIMYTNNLPVVMGGAEQLRILPDGIDFLTELKLINQKERSEKQQYNISYSISSANVVLALAAFVTTFMGIIINTPQLVDNLGETLFFLLLTCILVIFIIMGFLIAKSYTFLHKEN